MSVSELIAVGADIITVTLVVLGGAFSLLAAVGLLRMPDLYTRMQSATKAGTLGVACTAAAAAVHFSGSIAWVEAIIVIFFFFLTAPVASHLIARASYTSGHKLWDRTVRDDYADARSAEQREVLDPRDLSM
ncbi:MAG: monovalent cation/H(+) antiporter subunit G [Phycisphaerales bacterium]